MHGAHLESRHSGAEAGRSWVEVILGYGVILCLKKKKKEIQGTTALTTTTRQSDPWRRKKIFLSHLKSSGCLNWGKSVFCCCCRKISSYKILTSQVGPGLMDATNPGRSGVSGSILYRHQTLPRAALQVPWGTWLAPAAFLLSTMPGSQSLPFQSQRGAGLRGKVGKVGEGGCSNLVLYAQGNGGWWLTTRCRCLSPGDFPWRRSTHPHWGCDLCHELSWSWWSPEREPPSTAALQTKVSVRMLAVVKMVH